MRRVYLLFVVDSAARQIHRPARFVLVEAEAKRVVLVGVDSGSSSSSRLLLRHQIVEIHQFG